MEQAASAGAMHRSGLARNSIGTTHIVFFVVAAAAPLASVVGASPAAFTFGNGAGVPGVYLLVGCLYLMFSVGFAAMARFSGSVDSFYAFITKGLGRPAGVAAASISLLTYKMIQMAVYALFGVFLTGALAAVGIDMPWWLPVPAIMMVIWLYGARNIAFSGKLLGRCMLAETAILFALDPGILMRGGNAEGIALTSFAPRTVFAPLLALTGLIVALALVLTNLPLLAGSDSPFIWSFPWIAFLFGLMGAAYAIFLRNRRPALYAALGMAITEV